MADTSAAVETTVSGDDFSNAVSSAVSELEAGDKVGSGQEVTPEPAEEDSAPPAKEAAPTPKQEDEEEPETFGATAEELALIQQDPKLLKVYKSLQRGFTKKTMSLSEQAKELKAKADVADWIKSDPDKAIRALAEARGISLAAAKQEVKDLKADVKDELEEEWAKTTGGDVAKVFRPLIEKTASKIAQQMIEQTIGPLRQVTTGLAEAATDRGLSAAIREFGATVEERGEDWDDDVQAEMAAVMGRVAPGTDENGQPIPVDEYLDNIHGIVMAQRARKEGLKSQIRRLKAAQETEPRSAVSNPEQDEDKVKSDMSDDQAVALAVKLARAAASRRR